MPTVAKWVGSPNRTNGRKGYRPEAVVVHIMEGSLSGTDQWFNNPESQVSAHYGIGRNGQVHQYVAEADTAWHAGRIYKAQWGGLKSGVNPNLYTIGIEHEGEENSDWPDAMYNASAALIREICNRWSIPIDRDHIVGHREIYAHKTCPGKKVDLKKLIQLARQEAVDTTGYNFVAEPGTVQTRVKLNVRRGAPTTAAPVARTVAKGKPIEYAGWTSNGLSVHGNPHWYRDADGNYFWAGGTDRPTPGL